MAARASTLRASSRASSVVRTPWVASVKHALCAADRAVSHDVGFSALRAHPDAEPLQLDIPAKYRSRPATRASTARLVNFVVTVWSPDISPPSRHSGV